MVDRALRIKIMVVDDEDDIAHVMQKVLETEGGFDVDAFTDPKQAIEQFKVHAYAYQVVLSDVRMPYIGGLELAKEIRNLNQKVSILLMSALEMEDRQEFASELRAARIDGFVEKPMSMKKLVELIRQYVSDLNDSSNRGMPN
jgi:two-component system, OmpR family, copper resistance phosphate regulon response regulator CusR